MFGFIKNIFNKIFKNNKIVSRAAPFLPGGDFFNHIPKHISQMEGGNTTGIAAGASGQFVFQAPSTDIHIYAYGNDGDTIMISLDDVNNYSTIPSSVNSGWLKMRVRTSRVLWRAPDANNCTAIYVLCTRGQK